MLETMHDRGKFWTPSPGEAAILAGNGFEARCVCGLGQTLVSGNLPHALAMLAPGAPETGLWAIASADSYSVRLSRDRALVVTPAPLDVAPGWRDGYVATPCDDAYAVVDLSGSDLRSIVAEAASADLEGGSRSAALLFAGVPVMLYRIAQDTARLHVERPLLAYLWQWLDGRR